MAERAADKSKVIEVTLEIAAPVEKVWKAITDPRELERWFPLRARVTPGEGGEVFMSWGPPWEGASRIDAWEENQRLRTRGFLEHGDASLVEYTLETRGGKTLLRLVHSGFARGSDWEDELFGGTERGWRYELRSLRHYLERHAGTDRRVLWPKAKVRGSAAEVWKRLLGKDGFTREGSIDGLREGDRYRVTAATGDVLAGRVLVNDPPFEFSGTVESLNDGLVALRTHDVGGPDPKDGHAASVWVSSWGAPQKDLEALGERWRRLLDRVEAADGWREQRPSGRAHRRRADPQR
jgi:uncharacterized protein YndB with AHSA1/START domain